MKRFMVKITALVLIVTLCLSLTACGGEKAAQEEATPAPEYVYQPKELGKLQVSRENALAAEPGVMTPEGYYAIGGIFGEKNIPEGAVEEYEGQFQTYTPVISFVSLDGKVKQLDGYTPVEDKENTQGLRDYAVQHSIRKLLLTPKGQLAVIENVYTSWSTAGEDVKYGTDEYYSSIQSTDESWYRILSAEDGSELSRGLIPVGGSEGIEVEIYTSAVDEQDNFVTSNSEEVIAFTPKGEIAYRIPFKGYSNAMANLADGKVALAVYDYTDYTDKILIIDSRNACFEDKSYKLNVDLYGMLTGGEGDLYLIGWEKVYAYNFEDETAVKLFSWIDCDLLGNSLGCPGVSEDGSILCVSSEYNSLNESTEVQILELGKTPYDPAAEKSVITYATLWLDDNVAQQIINFNRSHKDVRIEVLDYSEYNTEDDYSKGETKLMTEMAAGNMPDILDFSNSSLAYQRMAASGMLMDLYPFLEGDKELSAGDIVPNFLKAMEINGGLYTACSGVGIYTMAGAASVVGSEPGMTFEEYREALATMPEGCEGMDAGMTKAQILTITAALEMEDYLDWATGECKFDSDSFISMLEYVNSFPDPTEDMDYDYGGEDSARSRVAQGKQMLTMCVLTSVDFFMDDYDGMFGGEATFVGFPTNHGVGNLIMPLSSVAITSGCKDPEGAWEFVRNMFTEKFQSEGYFIPTNAKVLESKIKDAMKVEYVTDANGNFVLDEKGERIPQPLGSFYDGANMINIYSLTQRQADMLRNAIENTTRVLNFDNSIDNILQQEAAAYFAGDKTAQEVAKLIQSKISIYVNEQR